MEGRKLMILFLFAVLNDVYVVPQVSSQDKEVYTLEPITEPRINEERKEIEKDAINNQKSVKDTKYYARRYTGLHERPLSVGDTFTPAEFLPVTRKLIEKVENPGVGKGIVSGARSPEDLADKLFEAFFYTKRRIVQLDERDITGLDALQALAISGHVTLRRAHEYIAETEAPDEVTLSFRGQTISVNAQPVKSKYQLLSKKDNKIIKKVFVRRGGIKLAQKLWNNRHLIVNPGRKHNGPPYRLGRDPELNSPERVTSNTRENQNQGQQNTKKNEKYCHWKYVCSNPTDLDTCDLKTVCNKDSPIVEFHGIPHLPDENTPQMREFRKMLGITLIDEEVEKILEKRFASIDLPHRRPGPDIDRLESLSEYFRNIIMNDMNRSTQPFKVETTERISHHLKQGKIKPEPRNFETPTRSTPKPSDHNL